MVLKSRRNIKIPTELLQELIGRYRSLGNTLIPLVACLIQASDLSSKVSRLALDLEASLRMFRINPRIDILEDLEESLEMLSRYVSKDILNISRTLPQLQQKTVVLTRELSYTLEQTRDLKDRSPKEPQKTVSALDSAPASSADELQDIYDHIVSEDL